uniref:Uncharacterized protein n=1 Tax=Anguilla anguilla TaxID=7936 RepID=A0A0E9WTK0_ANGAN
MTGGTPVLGNILSISDYNKLQLMLACNNTVKLTTIIFCYWGVKKPH